MDLAAYALTSAMVFLLVFAAWQAVAARSGTDPAERRAARRSATTFTVGAVMCGAAAGVLRLLG